MKTTFTIPVVVLLFVFVAGSMSVQLIHIDLHAAQTIKHIVNVSGGPPLGPFAGEE